MDPSFITTPSERLVLCSGHYNIMHAGHVELYEYARSLGDRLVVGINGDRKNQQKYGAAAIPAWQRRQVIASCRYVDQVVVFEEDDPSSLIRLLRPRVFVRGPDYSGVLLPEQAALNEVGCFLVIQPTAKIASSTAICSLVQSSKV